MFDIIKYIITYIERALNTENKVQDNLTYRISYLEVWIL